MGGVEVHIAFRDCKNMKSYYLPFFKKVKPVFFVYLLVFSKEHWQLILGSLHSSWISFEDQAFACLQGNGNAFLNFLYMSLCARKTHVIQMSLCPFSACWSSEVRGRKYLLNRILQGWHVVVFGLLNNFTCVFCGVRILLWCTACIFLVAWNSFGHWDGEVILIG